VVAGFSAKDRSAAMMPLFHTAQLNGVITPLVYVGGTAFLLRGFDPEKLLELISREKITHIFGLPMMYRMMLDHPNFKKYDLSSLRLALYAMAPMPDIDLRRAIDSFGCDFMLGFGQTEMNPLTTMFMPEHQLSHSGSVGTQIPNVQTAIMGEDGNLLPIGESGEIVYRGPHVMEGYLHNDKATAEAFEHGWFHSGDVGHFDADGVLWFEDRKKDVIKTGGENVASIEVERALYDAEERIGEVVVVGLYHERWGEAVTAFVVPKPADVGTLTPLHIQAAAKNCLDGFKQPKAVIILEELPRTATGKVQKNVLRDRYRDYYRTNLS
jgi:acyl-CoA synthetase (AMP-forming)/AMP-acid ligase II